MTLAYNPLVPAFMPSEMAYASIHEPYVQALQRHPSLATRSSPFPSSSTRLRRSNGSSSDEEPVPGPDGFIEEDLRAGGPHLCESPCDTLNTIPRSHRHYASVTGDRGNKLVEELDDICQNAGVTLLETRFCGRRCAFDTNTQPALTFLVLDKRQGVLDRAWMPLAKSLHRYLQRKGLGDINVEITDPRFGRRPSVFPCTPNDGIFHVWGVVAEDIMSSIDLTGIFTIGCFRVGEGVHPEGCPPTVLFGVDRRAPRDWKVVREATIEVLEQWGLTAVAVLIRKDTSTDIADYQQSLTTNPTKLCTKHANPGFSLSPHDNKDALGTLGGWVELKSPQTGNWVPFAITCFRCVLPSMTGFSESDLRAVEGWKYTGVPAKDETAERLLKIDSPSRRDLGDVTKELAISINEFKNDPTYKKVENALACDDFVTPYEKADWKRTADNIADHSEKLRVISEFIRGNHYILGSVFASSGLQEVPSKRNPSELSIRDWALVNVGEGRRPGANTVNIELPKISQLRDFVIDTPPLDSALYKIGRATGFTKAKYGGLEVAHIAERVVDGELTTVKTWEHTFVAESQINPVVMKGDPGSLVFNRSGRVVGLLFGGSFSGDVGYFTHILDVVEHIKSLTKAVDFRIRGQAF